MVQYTRRYTTERVFLYWINTPYCEYIHHTAEPACYANASIDVAAGYNNECLPNNKAFCVSLYHFDLRTCQICECDCQGKCHSAKQYKERVQHCTYVDTISTSI